MHESPKKPTITDVAKIAGVSKTTVSHVINSSRFVEETTKNRVLNAIAELKFSPNSVARSLANNKTNTIGLVVSDIGNPFYHNPILGVEEVALASGNMIFLFNANYDVKRSLEFVQTMVSRKVDGMIFMSSRLDHSVIEETEAYNLVAVVVDYAGDSSDRVGKVVINFEPGIRQLVSHLLSLGHKRFAFVGDDSGTSTASIRRDLFLRILNENKIPETDCFVCSGNFRIDGGRRAFHAIKGSWINPTAVLAVNDMTAIGIVQEAQDNGLSVPKDLSVVGVDNIEIGRDIQPHLTTIAIPGLELGKLSMNLLLRMLASHKRGGKQKVAYPQQSVETSLIVRRTTAPPSE
jgi:LacI family transcriptional regulator